VPIRVVAITPCYNRPRDVRDLLRDVRALKLPGIELRVLIVDNNSKPPLADPEPDARVPARLVRSPENRGGAGGFNVGMTEALGDRDFRPHYLWLLDSDVRLDPDVLRLLVELLERRGDLCAAGSELRDTTTGITYEIGGMISRETGHLFPAHFGPCEPGTVVGCEYLAACSMLVRAEAVRRTGLMPDVFLYNDDVEWSLALREASGQNLAGIAGSIVYHPWRKFQGVTRFYASRNAFGPAFRLGLRRRAIFKRGIMETGYAISLAITGLVELANAHIFGLEACAAGRRSGPGPGLTANMPEVRAFTSLIEEVERLDPGRRATFVHPSFGDPWAGFDDLRKQLRRMYLDPGNYSLWHSRSLVPLLLRTVPRVLRRLFAGAVYRVAIVPMGWTTNWLHGETMIVVVGNGFITMPVEPWKALPRTFAIGIRGLWASLRIALGRRRVLPLPPAPPDPRDGVQQK